MKTLSVFIVKTKNRKLIIQYKPFKKNRTLWNKWKDKKHRLESKKINSKEKQEPIPLMINFISN